MTLTATTIASTPDFDFEFLVPENFTFFDDFNFFSFHCSSTRLMMP